MPGIANGCMAGVVLSLIIVAGCRARDNDTTAETSGEPSSEAAIRTEAPIADNLTVYYFHTTYRCWTCNQFEKLTKEILDDTFPDQLADGSITFRVINIEEEPNRHFIEDYRLVTKSLVLSLQKDGRELEWMNLDRIWRLVRDTERFKAYVSNAIEEYSRRTG